MSVIDRLRKSTSVPQRPEPQVRTPQPFEAWTAPPASTAENEATQRSAGASVSAALYSRDLEAKRAARAQAERERIEVRDAWWADYKRRTGR